MEQENRLEQNRYSKPFVGLSTAQEADSFITGSDKETPNTCVATREVDNLVETLMRKKQKNNHKTKSRCVGEWGVEWSTCSLFAQQKYFILFWVLASRTLTASIWPSEVPFNKALQAVFTGRGVNYEASSLLVLDHCLDFKRLGLHCLVEISCFGSQKKQDLSSVSLDTMFINLCWYFNWREHNKINKNYFCFFSILHTNNLNTWVLYYRICIFCVISCFQGNFPSILFLSWRSKGLFGYVFECKVTHIDRYND